MQSRNSISKHKMHTCNQQAGHTTTLERIKFLGKIRIDCLEEYLQNHYDESNEGRFSLNSIKCYLIL